MPFVNEVRWLLCAYHAFVFANTLVPVNTLKVAEACLLRRSGIVAKCSGKVIRSNTNCENVTYQSGIA